MTLKYTADQVHKRQVGYVGVRGIPAPWWSIDTGNDCLGFQLYTMGVRTRTDFQNKHVSISAFRLAYGWHEIPIDDLRFGDVVLEEWPALGKPFTGVPNHAERFVTRNRDTNTITTTSANTGPRPGVSSPRGAWEKTRVITNPRNFVVGIRPPYAGTEITSPYGAKEPLPHRGQSSSGLSKAHVKVLAKFLNERLGGTDTGAVKDGVPGEVYWTLVQTWGRQQNIYGHTYKIDGIPGPRTRQVEAVAYKAATKK